MGFEDFLEKIRTHWIAVVLLIVLLYVAGNFFHVSDIIGSPSLSMIGENAYSKSYPGAAGGMAQRTMATDAYYPSPPISEEFAPQERDRKITKEAYLQSEVKRGAFEEAQNELRRITLDAKGFVLNENLGRYGKDESKTGTYSLKIPASSYEHVVTQLKSLGEVLSFTENQADITGSYLTTQARIPTEQARLQRYKALYEQWGNLGEKLQLEERLFQQEQYIQNLQDSLKNMDQRVEYSSVQVTLREKESTWTRIDFVGIGSLATTFVSSLNSVLYFISALLPWVVLALILWMVYRFVRKKFGSKR